MKSYIGSAIVCSSSGGLGGIQSIADSTHWSLGKVLSAPPETVALGCRA